MLTMLESCDIMSKKRGDMLEFETEKYLTDAGA